MWFRFIALRVKREVKDVDMIYGQEMNRTTYNLARMNMILHDVHFAKFDIKQEDTLTRPQHIDQRFEAVVANPPSQQNGQRTQASYKMNVSAVLVSLRQAQKQIWLLFSTCFINWMSKAQWPLFFRMVYCSVVQVKV
jgi:type I restriction-modification system DNA methylase subunit